MSGDGDEVLYAELAGDLRRRSHRAFERIFKEMGPRLYRFAFSYLMNAEIIWVKPYRSSRISPMRLNETSNYWATKANMMS